MTPQNPARTTKITRPKLPALYRPNPEITLVTITILKRNPHRQSHPSLAQIIARRLPHQLRADLIVKNIIHKLKRKTNIKTKLRKTRTTPRIRMQTRASLRRRGKKSGSLATQYLKNLLASQIRARLSQQTQHLAVRNNSRRVRQNLKRRLRVSRNHQSKGARQQKITRENTALVAPHPVRRRPPAPKFRVINNIIMQKRRGMQQFHSGGKFVNTMHLARRRVRKPRGGKRKKRTQPLSAMPRKMRRDRMNLRNVRPQLVLQNILSGNKVIAKNVGKPRSVGVRGRRRRFRRRLRRRFR